MSVVGKLIQKKNLTLNLVINIFVMTLLTLNVLLTGVGGIEKMIKKESDVNISNYTDG